MSSSSHPKSGNRSSWYFAVVVLSTDVKFAQPWNKGFDLDDQEMKLVLPSSGMAAIESLLVRSYGCVDHCCEHWKM